MGIMKTKKVNAFVAAVLIIVLTFANVCVLGMNVAQSFASSLEKGKEVTDEVEFSTYFDGTQDNSQACVASIDMQNLKLNLEVKVNSGCLQNSVIIFENPNFKLVDNAIVIPQVSDDKVTQEMLSAVQSIDTDYGCVYLNRLSKDTNIKIQIPVAMKNDANVQDTYFNQSTVVKFQGNYVTENGEEKVLAKDSSLNLVWHGDIVGKVTQGLLKYIPYNINDKKGVVVETVIGVGVENNKLPVKNANIQVNVPSINGIKPTAVEVFSNSNQKVDWSNSEDVLNIKIVNDLNSQNQINWDKTNLNNVNVICKYDENAYNSVINTDGSLKATTLNEKINGNVSVYNNEDTTVDINLDGNLVADKKVNDVISFETNYDNSVNKGYLYNNLGIETPYSVNYKIDISNKDIVDKVSIETGIDSVVTSDGSEYSLKIDNVTYTRNVTTKILKSEFLNILGENGKIEIYNGDTIITTIDNNSVVDENGYFVIDYSTEMNNLRIVTSKPVNEGILNIYNSKVITGLKMNTDILKNITNIRNNMTGKAIVETRTVDSVTNVEVVTDNPVINITTNKDIPMVEPVTKAKLDMNNSGLSTVVENSNIELRAVLESNDVSCMLYKDPTLEILLPEEFEQFNVNNVKLLFSDELKIDSATLETNENGRKVIKISLKGTQLNYMQNNLAAGPMVVINANIVVNKLTPSSSKDIEMYVVNNNDMYNQNYENNVDGRGKVTKTIEYIGPLGLVTGNTIVEENKETSSVSGEENVAQTETQAESKLSTMKLTLINNNEEICTDIKVLGRTPFKGNKDIQTGADLGSTFTAPLVSGIRTNDIDMTNMVVYYSYKEDATMDMNEENGWTERPEDFAQVHSYLIQLNGALVPGAKITFAYDVLVPNNLGFDASTKGTYKVDYKTVSKNNVILKDTVAASSVGIATETQPNLSVVVSSDKGDNATVKENEYVTLSIAVTNNGSNPIQNASVSSKVPDGTTYVEYSEEAEYDYTHYRLDPDKKNVEFTIDSLNANETKVFKYIVKINYIELEVNDICNDPTHYSDKVIMHDGVAEKEHLSQFVHELSDFAIDVKATADIKVSGYQISSNEYQFKAVRGYLSVDLLSDPMDTYKLVKGDEITYTADISNISVDRNLSDVVAKMSLQQGVEFEEAYLSYYKDDKENKITDKVTYDSNSRLVKADIGDLAASIKDGNTNVVLSANLVVKVKVSDVIANNQNKGEIYEQVLVNGKDVALKKDIDTYYSNQIIHNVQKADLSVGIESNIDQSTVLAGGDQVTYTISVTNTGSGYASNVAINDTISEAGTFVSGKLVIDGKETRLLGPTTVCNILAGQTAKMYVTVQANKLSEDAVLTNTADVESSTTEKINSDTVSHNVSKTVETIQKEDGTVVRVYRISGVAWFDANKNGARDDGEKIAVNTPIVLINADDGTTIATGTTDSNGKYEISNIPEGGKYNVVFLYDNTRFDLTTYQKEGVDESKNSDVIDMNVNINGTEYKAGVTDTLVFNGANFYNIDIGLIENQKFDMSLTKGITKVTVNSKNSGSQVKEYNGVQMAKVEIPGKVVNGTTVAVEYTITVTNEGAVAGYVKNIVDYMPQDLNFNGDLNKGWYSGESGYIYNASLANKILQPGESTSVKLVLTKQMTEDNLGLTVNSAEISECSNDQGLKDVDSTPNNKKTGEDDYSSANLVLSIKTGEKLATYIEIIVLACAFMGIGIFYIRKKSHEINTNFKF